MYLKEKNKHKLYAFSFVLFQIIIFSFLFNTRGIVPLGSMEKSILELLLILNSYWFITKGINQKEKVFSNKISLVVFILINLVISFFVAGKPIFLNNTIVSTSIKSFIVYGLVNILVFPLIFNFILLLDKIEINEKKKIKIEKKDIRKIFLIVFLASFVINFIASIGFLPGNMTSDSIDIACQAMGKYAISGGHPAFYTILLKLVFMIIPHVYGAILFNNIFMSLILAYIFTYLYKNNIKRNVLYVIAFIFIVSCNNLSLMTIFWKDIPFTISMLWLTFELYRIIKEKDEYFGLKLNILRLIISLMFVYLLRPNGMFPYYVSIGYLGYFVFKSSSKVKVIATIALSVFSIWFIQNPVFNFFNVKQSSINGGASSFAVKGIAAVTYYDNNLSEEDKKEIEKIAPIDVLKDSYSPYNIDTMSFSKNSSIINKGINKLGAVEIYKIYLKQLINNPKIIIRDRLDSNNLLWAYSTPDDGFNSTYVKGVWFPAKFNPKTLNMRETEPDIYMPNNNILNVPVQVYQKAVNETPLYYIFWRPAIPLTLLILLMYYMAIRKIKLYPMLFPTIISIMFWVMLLSHQSYRYLWFIFVNTFIAYVIVLKEKKS